MKILNALASTLKKKDNVVRDKIQYSKVKNTIDTYCKEYLKEPSDIFKFEAQPNILDDVLQYLDSKLFLEQYEYTQVAPTLFMIRLKEIELF
jgi:hypothetical protein